MAEFNNKDIYLVQVSDMPDMEIAIGIEQLGDDLVWFDTLRERRVNSPKIADQGKLIEVTSPGRSRVFIFQTLSLSDYNKHIRDQLEGKPSFKTRKEMVDFFNNLGSW